VEVDGEELGLFLVEGTERVLLETISVGVFAPRTTSTRRVHGTGGDAERRGGFMDTETVEIDGEEYPIFDVELDGDVEAVQLGTTTEGRFAAVDDPTTSSGANVRTGEQVDSLAPQPENFRRVTELQNLDRS
jgi:hypothetical protein